MIVLSKTLYAKTTVDVQQDKRFILYLIQTPIRSLEHDCLAYKSFISTEVALEDDPVICVLDLETKHNMKEVSEYTIIAYVQLQIISDDIEIIKEQEENKLNDEILLNDTQLSMNNKQTVSISIPTEEYELKPITNKEITKNKKYIYTIPDIQFKDENIPIRISKLQIKRSIATLCTAYNQMILNTPVIIVIDIMDEKQSKILISQLNQDIRNLREDNCRFKKKVKSFIPKTTKESLLVNITKKTLNFYIKYWDLSVVSFGIASIISVFISLPIKNSLITYTYEPTKELNETCIVAGFAETQRILDDAFLQGVLTQRFLTTNALASDIINNVLITQNLTKNILRKQFQTNIYYLGSVTPCKCQICKITQSPAENNFNQNLLTVRLQTDVLIRGIEKLTRGETHHPIYSDLPITGHFLKVHTLNDNSTIASCKKCIPFQTNSSKNTGAIVVSIITYVIGVLTLPLVAYFFKVGKKYLRYQKRKDNSRLASQTM